MINKSFENDDRLTVDYFTDLIEKHGVDYKALDWGSQAGQIERFRILSEIGITESDSVLDVGCGQGDYYQWLKKNINIKKYKGIDITEAMLDIAKKRFPEADFELNNANLYSDSEKWDFVVASGIFYLRQHMPDKFLQETVENLFYLS